MTPQQRWLERNRHTPKYKARTAWSHIMERCGNRNGKNPTYASVECRMTRDEFMAWAIPEYEHCLPYNPETTWSVDRINEGHYEIGNIQIIPLGENSRKRKENRSANAPDGFSWCRNCENYKPLESFGVQLNTVTGVKGVCMECAGQKPENRGWGQGKKWVTKQEAEQIKLLYSTGLYSMSDVGLAFDRSAQTIHNIVHGKTKAV